jgi:DedD protein
MNDHNLDDLIIDTNTPKQSKAKSLLTIIALLIVVLIVAIILTKIILKDPGSQQAALVDDNTEMVSPELTLQSASEKKTKNSDELSDMLKEEMQSPEQESAKQDTTASKETVVLDESKPAAPVHTKQTPKAAQAPKKEEKVTIPARVEPTAPHKTVTKKPVVKKAPPSPQPVSATYYVQVASYSKTPTPNSRLLTAIRKNGYHYKIFPSHGMKKILIGPYHSRAEADRAIVRIKDRITKDAFVFTK